MEALVKFTESLPDGLTETQQDNLIELVETLQAMEELNQQSIPALVSSRLRIEGARLWQNTSTDELAPEGINGGDMYVPGEILAKMGDGFVAIPLFGFSGNLRWLMGDRLPDCFSHDGKTSGATGAACENCPDMPFRNNELQDCARVWHWVFLADDCSRVFYVMFRGKSAKTGSNIRRLTLGRAGSKKIRLFAESEKNPKGTYYVWKQTLLGEKPSAPVKKLGRELGNMIAQRYEAIVSEDSAIAQKYDPNIDPTPPIDVGPSEDDDIEDM